MHYIIVVLIVIKCRILEIDLSSRRVASSSGLSAALAQRSVNQTSCYRDVSVVLEVKSLIREKKGEAMRNPKVAFRIRPMRTDDIPQVVELGRQNLFHYTSSALKFWHNEDPDGIIIAVTESESFARAQGNTLVGSIGIHQIPAFNRRGAVVFESDWKSLEYETNIPVNSSILSDELPSGVEILPFQSSLLPAIFEYDYSLMGYERKSLIEATCKEENSETLVAMKDGKCLGFGSIKLDIVEYLKIGPLYADNPSVAQAIMKRLITSMPEAKGFSIVTINTNLFANMMLEKFNVAIHKSYYRVSTMKRLLVDTKKVFAHLDLDFTPF
ncbi:n-acetyltransferase domain-containing protein [Trichonephila inaurata madagascariensis]|uniref:N-acetyltransferase domain-containing protein n=1 Tax=Trichonephila inaurata madagascariensis TaxID=2747483 RepID=A0A8X6YV15_9ARAC|nr:n-acetyltransferase domain-containing protein [Trichonephila inaurata madagascariensis]